MRLVSSAIPSLIPNDENVGNVTHIPKRKNQVTYRLSFMCTHFVFLFNCISIVRPTPPCDITNLQLDRVNDVMVNIEEIIFDVNQHMQNNECEEHIPSIDVVEFQNEQVNKLFLVIRNVT